VSTVHVVVPDSVDDPARPSGGNTYDRRVCSALVRRGWSVMGWPVAGAWPAAGAAARDGVAAVLAGLPDRALVVLDGLVACSIPEVLLPEARRLRLVVLVHLPLGVGAPEPRAGSASRDPRSAEGAVLSAARAVVVTSAWTRGWLRHAYGLTTDVVVAPPGVDPAPLSVASDSGGRLLCVGAVTPTKGQDVLVDALARLGDLDWSATCVGSTAVDPSFGRRVRRRADATGLGARVSVVGPRTGDSLAEAYASADLLVAPSRTETYGMVVTEALARAVPVAGSEVGGLPEALGRTGDGSASGLLVPPGDAGTLAAALRRWLTDPELRAMLRGVARRRRAELPGWSSTAATLGTVLSEAAA
jgi:glycosyltransferase involved in cell wall biosynthesis